MSATLETTVRERDPHGFTGFRGVLTRLVPLAVVVLLIGQIVLAWFAVSGFERALEPQLNRKAESVGRATADQLAFAIDELGIPPRELVGVTDFFDNILAGNADIEYLVLLDASSQVLFAQGLPPAMLERILPELPGAGAEAGFETRVADFIDGVFPIATGDDRAVAALHVGVSSEYVRGRLSEIVFDIITVTVVSLLVTLELLVFFTMVRVSEPLKRIEEALAEGARGAFSNRLALRARDEIGQLVTAFNRVLRALRQRYEDFRFDANEVRNAQIDEGIARFVETASMRIEERYRFLGGAELRSRSAMQIRAPLFLFIFSEELSRSFLPLFVARMSPHGAAMSDELLIGLPITLFMLAGAIMTPLGGSLADRFGARRVFLAGIVPVVAGYIGTFLAQGYYDLVAWRTCSGVGYGLIYIASQAWVAENTDERHRARGMAVFVGSVFVAAICGPPIGGMIADRIGFEATFLVSAALALVSGMIVYGILEDAERTRAPGRRVALGAGQWWTLLRDRRFFAVTFLAAVPGKLFLTGFLFYLVPLYLSELGDSPSAIGRTLTLYGVAAIAFTPFAARLADRSGRYAAVIFAGNALAGFGCLMSLFDDAVGGAFNAVMIAILALGIGYAMTLTSQLAVVQFVADRHDDMGHASVLGAYRLLERGGTVLGPLVAAMLAAHFGYRHAIAGIGVIVLACIACYALVMLLPGGGAPDSGRARS